jgi:hypothetical protein
VRALDGKPCAACCDNSVIMIWRVAPTVRALGDLRDIILELLGQFPRGVGILGIAEPGMPMLSAAERKFASDLLTTWGSQLRAIATVIEGHGFWAGATQSVMTAISLIARQPCPMRIFNTIDEALVWYTPHVADQGGHGSSAPLRQAIEAIRIPR